MKIEKYLVIGAEKSRYGYLKEKVELRERVPTLKGNQVSLRLQITIPDAVFKRPQLEASLVVPDTAIAPLNISPEMTDNISKIVKETTGLTIAVKVVEHEEEKRCQNCGKIKPDVHERPDSYARDVNNNAEAVHTVCDDCDEQNRQDI